MPEEKTDEEVPEKKEEPKPDVEEGTKTPTAIEAATALADRIDAGNKLALEITERNEKLAAQNMLGGNSNAGQAPLPKKELTDAEYKDQVMGGEVPE